jgi:5-methylcytosine-specific restriction enzyme subunit McrC
MPKHTLTVFEHDKLAIGEQGFDQGLLDALAKFNDRHGNKYFTPGFQKITFKSYVGVIQVGSTLIEILPKADNGENVSKWQQALLYMLKNAGMIKLNEFDNAAQHTTHSNLLDIYLYSFLKQVEQLLHAGLLKKYRTVRRNQTVLKGRLLVNKQVQHNYIHKERFFTEYPIYDYNNGFNRILKRALSIIQVSSVNYSIRQQASKLLLFFEGIDSWHGTPAEFKKLVFDRKSKLYQHPIELAKMIIFNFNPDLTAGNKPVLAILFDMNSLFEKYIYRVLKREEVNYSQYSLFISSQHSMGFWKHKSIRPDILINYETKKGEKPIKHLIIVDTKWKIIEDGSPSDNDLKQMYAYNVQFGSHRSVLFYPYFNQENSGIGMYTAGEQNADFKHGCELYFADLFDSQGSKMDNSFARRFLQYIIRD